MDRIDLKIRVIERRDNDQIENIIKQVMTEFGCVGCGYSIEDEEVQNMFKAYNHPKGKYFVITDNTGKLYGGAGIDRLKGGKDGICELKKMYFLEEIRGLGLGGEMLDLCLKSAKALGYKSCYLETVVRMKSANAMYAKKGFKILSSSTGNTGHSGCDTFYALDL